MILLVMLSACVMIEPGPLDGFRANFAAIKVEADYEFIRSFVDPRVIVERSFWTDPSFASVEIDESRLVGQWQCDGITQYFLFGSPQDLIDKVSKEPVEKRGAKMRRQYVPRIEALYDGTTYVGHPIADYSQGDPRYLAASADTKVGLVALGKAPLFWWLETPFPQLIEAKFGGVVPEWKRVMRQGRPLECEIYRINYGKTFQQLEVSFDPSLGFLPRLIRSVTGGGGTAQVWEFYLIDAKPCKAGGFVPTEWYESEFKATGMPDDYDDMTSLVPDARVLVGHLKVNKLKDRDRPVSLQYLKGVRAIAAIGGMVPLAETGTLSIGEVKSLTGRKLTEAGRLALPNLDTEELKATMEPPSRTSGFAVACAIIGLASGALLLYARYWKSSHLLVVAACLGAAPGCGTVVGPPIAKLSGVFAPDAVLYDLDQFEIPLTLVVRNDGNVTLNLLKADGGCSCRKIDAAAFPKLLRPGEAMPVSIRISQDRRTTAQVLALNFETDHGVIEARAPLTAISRNLLEPEAVSFTTLNEGQPWNFEVVHRQVYETSKTKPASRLVTPAGLIITKAHSRSGEVKSSPGLSYEDTTYRVDLNDPIGGLHKSRIQVVADEGRKLCQSDVLWKYLPFLSTIPERPVLGAHPIRVFLRCPDEKIELTRVVSCPLGLKAVISSPREVTILSSESGTPTLNEIIEVETSAQDRQILRIPLVKYAPQVPEVR